MPNLGRYFKATRVAMSRTGQIYVGGGTRSRNEGGFFSIANLDPNGH